MTERKTHLDAIALGSLVFCCFLWGLNQVAAKSAMPEIPALWQAAARSTGGAALVWLWSRSRGIVLFDRDATLSGGLLAGTLFAAEFFCIFVACSSRPRRGWSSSSTPRPSSSPSACR